LLGEGSGCGFNSRASTEVEHDRRVELTGALLLATRWHAGRGADLMIARGSAQLGEEETKEKGGARKKMTRSRACSAAAATAVAWGGKSAGEGVRGRMGAAGHDRTSQSWPEQACR
jgi:hypothetical protein